MIGAMAPVGTTLGGLLSGIITIHDENQWPWYFYAFTIAGVLNLSLSYYAIPDNIPTNVHKLSIVWTGSIIGVTGLLIFNFVWNQAPIDVWDQAYIIVLLIISFFLIIAFFVFEVKYAKAPLLPKAVIGNIHLIMILVAIFFGWGTFGVWSFYYFSFVIN